MQNLSGCQQLQLFVFTRDVVAMSINYDTKSRSKDPLALGNNDTEFLCRQHNFLCRQKWIAWSPMLLFTHDDRKKEPTKSCNKYIAVIKYEHTLIFAKKPISLARPHYFKVAPPDITLIGTDRLSHLRGVWRSRIELQVKFFRSIY